MTWKHPSSPVTKKFKVQQSASKVMATVFWDSRGMTLLDILPKGESVNADRYCETLDWLRHAVRRKRSGLLCSGVVLQHDNATPHTAKRTKEWLERYRWDIIPHPAHSPDFAPSDFHLFGPLKRPLGGKSLRMKTNSLVKFVTGFQSFRQTFSHRVYIRFFHGGKNA
ncbi:histone-lysine N-methyltransferase SETMAR [Plakobranchus ocellatus]|uniref:Histone-lysine N-methyltransferase SETMAR n=1 Tax=Plakobranchus ocellatus TaxID=259542 RepID=A0AAV3Y066_9GAST|nr:histone-lysine N-methyltransferase SETMAR [Plakobranchus ocellatus]